ncbi:MAG TPA: pitrilysin family protein [Blastocatellia bacterium]|jgi:predicted Zn-dependent peptidase|nr:pitrilysin family protein [Blastocatellia bacterium]
MKRPFIATLIILFATVTCLPVKADDGALTLPPYKRLKLNNGMVLLLMEQREIPLISFNMVIKAGSTADPAGKEGIASLTAALLRKGTKARTADQISSDLDFIGGQLNATATHDYSNAFAEFVKKDIAKGLDLLAEVVLTPQFPQDEVTKLLKQRIDGVKAAKDQAQGVIGNYFNTYLYGSHPYGRASGGDETSLAAITRDDVQKFYQANYTPANTILAVAGDFDSAEMERLLRAKFGAWPAKTAPTMSIPAVTPFAGKKLLLVDKPDSTQTFYLIGNTGITRTNPDRFYIRVINTLFGGRFTSMLNTELRIKSGLSYGARSSFVERKERGPFIISTFTANETTEKAIDLTLEVLKRLHEKGITEEELKSAKTYIKGQYPPTIETTDQLAGVIAQLELYGLDQSEVNGLYAKIDSMTVADARRVIKEHFPLDNLVFVLIGKAEEINKVAAKYAPKVDTKSISQPGF